VMFDLSQIRESYPKTFRCDIMPFESFRADPRRLGC